MIAYGGEMGIYRTAIEKYGKLAAASDLIDCGYGKSGVDFLRCSCRHNGDIVTNQPFRYALEFVQKALELIPVGR